MRLAVRVGMVSVVLIGLSIPSHAQPSSTGLMVFGAGAAQKLWDDEGSIGTGVAGGGGIGVRLSESWDLRGRVMRSQNHRDFGNGVVFENSGTRYTAELLWKPTGGPHAAYFGGGVGVTTCVPIPDPWCLAGA